MNLQNYKSASCETAFLPLEGVVKPVSIEAALSTKMKLIKDLGRIRLRADLKTKSHYAIYECDFCGKEFTTVIYRVNSGHTKSCGCRNGFYKHGLIKTRLYKVWVSMRFRCNNPNFSDYRNYGGRGIKVCDEWQNSFISFYEWSLKNGWIDGLEIERNNNDGNYEPSNCRYITHKQQQRNKRTNHLITFRGKTRTIAEWSDITGIRQNTILTRINRGWSIKNSLFKIKQKGGFPHQRKGHQCLIKKDFNLTPSKLN